MLQSALELNDNRLSRRQAVYVVEADLDLAGVCGFDNERAAAQ